MKTLSERPTVGELAKALKRAAKKAAKEVLRKPSHGVVPDQLENPKEKEPGRAER